ncbi:MAG TPA: gamma-glutamyl-phosphate reductase, partial [Micromonosporaceae bacterium]|nr:gamma-glutamyl-phosphate reductase [Micromonosporaceae bacterium]
MSTMDQARRAREAAVALAVATRTTKDAALHAMADALVRRTPQVLLATGRDVAAARSSGAAPALVDRLALDEGRVAGMAAGLRQ